MAPSFVTIDSLLVTLEMSNSGYSFIVNFDLSAACESSSVLVAQCSKFLLTGQYFLVYWATFAHPVKQLQSAIMYR